MENPIPTLIKPWLVEMISVDWLNFQYHGLASFRYLQHVPLRPALLFWDPEFHVFRFGDDEICPTVEEFQAYLRTYSSSTLVVPPYQVSMPRLLATALDIPRGLANSMLEGGQVHILQLIERYNPEGDLRDTAWQARRRLALMICLLAAYLLIPADGRVSSLLVSVALQMGGPDRQNVIPLVLAETLIGLDSVYSGVWNTFSGSPLLLQLWLSDKLNLLHPPEDGWVNFPRRIHQRRMRYPEMDIEEWYSFMQGLQPDEIVWRCPWLDLGEMVVHSEGFDRVVIAGLTQFTFYIPGRILRQLGIPQGNVRITARDFWVPNFNAQALNGYKRRWGHRALQAESPDFTPRLRNVYRQWLRADV